MKIAFTGVPGVGKTDLVNKVMQEWPSYSNPVKKNEDLYLANSRYDIGMLDKIMDEFVNDAMFVEGKFDIVHDGCIFDALAHIFMFFSMHPEADTSILAKYQGLFNAAIQYYDCIFYIPYNTAFKRDSQEITKEEFLYRCKLDKFYQVLFSLWKEGDKTMYPFESSMGCPAIIEIFGKTLQDQMILLKSYIDKYGNPIPPIQKEAAEIKPVEKEPSENEVKQ